MIDKNGVEIKGYVGTQRVVIIDYNHMAHAYQHGNVPRLSCKFFYNGVHTEHDTTIPAFTIKRIAAFSNRGFNPIVVCMDAPIWSRKKAIEAINMKWAEIGGITTKGKDGGAYKGGRATQFGSFYDGVNLTAELLIKGDVTVLRQENYEADDLIFAAVLQAKKQFPNLPIDIITGDMDLLPLVDEQVSVYFKSPKQTHHEDGCPKITKYLQFTCDNFEEIIQIPSAMRKLSVPYGTLLLAKILRGDSADNLKGKKGWTPTKYNNLIQDLINTYGYEGIAQLGRYGEFIPIVRRKGTGEVCHDYHNLTKEDMVNYYLTYDVPKELTTMLDMLRPFVTDEDLDFIYDRYKVMALNGAFIEFDEANLNRRPFQMGCISTNYWSALNDSAGLLEIRLK